MKGHTSCPGAFGVAGFHLTNQGPGIFGQGNPAGLFEGDVNVTGALSVQGSNVLQRIGALEQQPGGAALEQKIAALQAQLSSLQNQVNTAVSNLTGRVSLAEVAISSLEARVGALGGVTRSPGQDRLGEPGAGRSPGVTVSGCASGSSITTTTRDGRTKCRSLSGWS